MKVCIIGAGAIGGFIGTRLAAAGSAEVSAVARGATLEALQGHGWRLQTADGLLQAPARATDRPGDLEVQDVVVIAVKGPALAGAVETLAPLLGPDTMVVPAMNGVPWWFCQGLPGWDDVPLASVDPGGRIAGAVPRHHVVGCVVHAATSTPEPGLVQHAMGQGLVVGEPGGGRSERVQRLTDLLTHAGFEATHSADVRHDIWFKLWGNMTMNPVSAMTGATMDLVLDDDLVRGFCSAAMQEAARVGELIGCPIDQSPEERHVLTRRLGAVKTSMLQDVEAGRVLEIDSIVAAVQEIGRRAGVATPNIDALLGLARLLARVRGLYPVG